MSSRPQGGLTAGVAGFYYDVNDLIERPNRDALYGNIEEATFSGAELWTSYRGVSGLDASMNYTLVDASNTVAEGGDQDLPYVPDHMLQAEIGYRFGFGTRIAPSITYRGEAVEYNDDGEPIDIPDHTLVDLSVHHEMGWGVILTLQATNLLDRTTSRKPDSRFLAGPSDSVSSTPWNSASRSQEPATGGSSAPPDHRYHFHRKGCEQNRAPRPLGPRPSWRSVEGPDRRRRPPATDFQPGSEMRQAECCTSSPTALVRGSQCAYLPADIRSLLTRSMTPCT